MMDDVAKDKQELPVLLEHMRWFLTGLKWTGIEQLPANPELSAASGMIAEKLHESNLQEESEKALLDIRNELGDCRRCRLHEQRTNIVFGEGSALARLVFVGEGPGLDEDRQGRPFVGRAGKLLDKMIAAMGYERSQVYICNVVKCRPPNNRTPNSDEINTCSPFLVKQISAIRPQVICALGACAAQNLLGTTSPISRLRGRVHFWRGIPLVATFHPAYLLRNPAQKSAAWQDLLMVQEILKNHS